MRIKILVISFFIILSACNQRNTEINTKTIDSKLITDNVFSLSNLGYMTSLIPLETTDSSLISSINKMYFDKNYIYILDKNGGKGVYLFNRNGKFIRKIGKIGKGPGEYLSIDDFTIDKNNLIIYLLTNRKNVLLYDLKGKYIRSFKTGFYASKIEYNNSSNRIYFIGDDLGDNIVIADLNGRKINGFFPNKDFGHHVRILNNPFNNLDTIVLYRRFLDDNIYELKNDSLFVHYKIDFGNDALSGTRLKEILKLDNKEFKSSLQKFKCEIKFYVENKNKVLALFYYNKIPHLCIYEKAINKSEVYSIINLKDDILYAETFPLIEYVTDNNEFVFQVEPGSLIKNEKNIKSESIKNLVNAMINKSNLKIDCNPIICILKDESDE